MMSVSPVTRKTSWITSNPAISVAIRSASFVSTFNVMIAATWSSPYRAVRACSMSPEVAMARGIPGAPDKASREAGSGDGGSTRPAERVVRFQGGPALRARRGLLDLHPALATERVARQEGGAATRARPVRGPGDRNLWRDRGLRLRRRGLRATL